MRLVAVRLQFSVDSVSRCSSVLSMKTQSLESLQRQYRADYRRVWGSFPRGRAIMRFRGWVVFEPLAPLQRVAIARVGSGIRRLACSLGGEITAHLPFGRRFAEIHLIAEREDFETLVQSLS